FYRYSRTFREWTLVRLRGSRENWGEPLVFLLTRYLFWLPVGFSFRRQRNFVSLSSMISRSDWNLAEISLTDNLPDEISRYVGRHFPGVFWVRYLLESFVYWGKDGEYR